MEIKHDSGRRYIVSINGVDYYLLVTPYSVNISYEFENREENIMVRSILEQFCACLTNLMKENNYVCQALEHVAGVGESCWIEGKDPAA